jgi:hypothetical protein
MSEPDWETVEVREPLTFDKVHLRCIRCNELIADGEQAKSALNPWHQACFDRAFEVPERKP